MSFENPLVALLETNVTPYSADYVMRQCDRIEQEFAQIPSAYRWTLHYKRFQVEAAAGNMQPALRHLKAAIELAPYNQDLLEDYRSHFASKKAAISQLMLLISCKKYEQKARHLAAQFDAAGLDYLIISGNDTAPIMHPRALQVDAPDNYESLPLKVGAACIWVLENLGDNVGVLKVDDDQNLFDPQRLKNIIERLRQADAYAGVPVSGTTHDRNWHWNKCQDKALNRVTYGKPFLRHWAMGGAYYLAPGPLARLASSLIRFPGLYESEYYEDKMVGDALFFEGVNLTPLKAYEEFGLRLTEAHRFNAP